MLVTYNIQHTELNQLEANHLDNSNLHSLVEYKKNVLSQEFAINKELIKKDSSSKENKENKKWYYSHYEESRRNKIKEE